MDLRRRSVAPPILPIVVATMLLVSAYIVLSILLVPDGEVREFQFASEHGTITALSAVLLSLSGAFALVSGLVSPDRFGRFRLFWFLIAVGLAFLALDELLQFHERIGYRLDAVGVLGEAVQRSPIRKWDDMVVILYGVAALPAALLFLPSMLRLPRVAECLAVAAVFYVIHTATDALVEPRTTTSVIVEESAKLLCGAFLALATLAGVLAQVERVRSTVRRVPLHGAATAVGSVALSDPRPAPRPAKAPAGTDPVPSNPEASPPRHTPTR